MKSFRVHAHAKSCLVALALVAGCGGGSGTTNPLAVGVGVTATIVGDQVQIRNDLQMPIEYALIEEYWLEHALASWCFGSGGCGTTIEHGQTATPLISSGDHMSPSATKLVVVWWSIPEEPPPMGGPSTPYKIVLDVR
ncbi:MAG: hypothetical protein ACJ8B6_07190 [Gemmatimonadales bacterium]